MHVLPIAIQGAFRTSTKEYIEPVPAFETLRIDFPKDLSVPSLLDLQKVQKSLFLQQILHERL